MHALVTRVTIHDADHTREMLDSQVVPAISGAPGFQAGYWTWSTGGGELTGFRDDDLRFRRERTRGG
jgi:hypothetical protein